MADETTTTWTELLREARGPLVEALRYKTVLLSEVQRDKNPRRWHGKQITIPIFLAPQQGAGAIREVASGNATATINAPQTVTTDQAVINTAVMAIAVSFTTQVLKQADGDENSWAQVIPTKMQRAEDAFKRAINEQMVGGSTATGGGALLAACTGANNNSTTVTVGTSANFYQLYPGRVVDVLTRSTGAAVGSSTGVSISDQSESGGTITVSVALTTSTNEGVYIQGSWGNAIQGLGQATATTGTFETIDKAAVPAWRGIDASPAATSDPSIGIFDRSERLAMQRAGRQPDFYLCDPGVVDKYTQGLTVQARWSGEEGTLASGWSGVRYRDKLLVPEYDMPLGTAYGITLEDCAIYTLDDGPDWDDYTGSIFQRSQSTRTLPVEAWLVWMLQFGFSNCNSFVKVGSLNRAA